MAGAEKRAKEAEPSPEKIEIVVALERPIEAHGETMKEIKFREPTGADIEVVGFPLEFDFRTDPPGVSLHERKMGAMMVRLGAIPPSSVKMMSTKDWSTAAWRIAGFFMPSGPI